MATKTSFTYKDASYVTTSAIAPHGVSAVSKLLKVSKSRTSVPNPKWKQIIEDGGNATTAMTAWDQSVNIIPGFTKYTFKDSSTIERLDTGCSIINFPLWSNDPFMGGNIPQSQIDAAVAQATSRTYAKVRAYQTPFEGQIFAGELKEIFALVSHPLQKATKLTDELLRVLSADRSRTKFIKGAAYGDYKPLSKSVADIWLEYRFAVLPLFSDISSLLVLAAEVANRREYETIRSYGSSVRSLSQNISTTTSHGWIRGVNTTDYIYTAENIIRCGLTARFLDSIDYSVNPWVNSVNDVMSVPVTAWELFPFSFLLDYFVNIGDIISSSVVSQSALSYTSNSIITTVEVRQASLSTYIDDSRIGSIIATEPKIVTTKSRYVKRSGGLLGIPPVTFSLPGSAVRYGNMAALITSWYSKTR